ncbi:TraX family protein [Pseudoxanthomonas mexicana]
MMTSFSREWLKWSALLLMTGDHVNKALLHGAYPWLTDAARVVFPIFAFVLVANLYERPGASTRAALVRLLVAAVIAQPFHAWAFGSWFPLNVLFTLALGVYVCSAPGWLPVVAWVLLGAFVDYQWFGVLVMASAAVVMRTGGASVRAWLLLVGAVASLYFINGNFWALASLPLIGLFSRVPGNFPRSRWTFLGYYVGHLALLAILSN